MATRPRHLVLCTNARTLLCVVVPLAPHARLGERFAAAARVRIERVVDAPIARLMPFVVLASILATLVAALALSAGATGRGVGLLLLVAIILVAPRVSPRVARWFRGYRQPLVALALLVLIAVALFRPTPLFIVDKMVAVPP